MTKCRKLISKIVASKFGIQNLEHLKKECRCENSVENKIEETAKILEIETKKGIDNILNKMKEI